jgi:hypothetical protein
MHLDRRVIKDMVARNDVKSMATSFPNSPLITTGIALSSDILHALTGDVQLHHQSKYYIP